MSSSPSVLLACNARDEADIEEWVIYHRLKGFRRILIFDHRSKRKISTVLDNQYAGVDVIYVDDEFVVKHELMKRAMQYCTTNGIEFLFYIDADEFFYSNKFDTIQQLLQSMPGQNNILINWLVFGSNYHDHTPPGLLLHNYTRSDPRLNNHVKSLVRVAQVNSCENAHFYYMKAHVAGNGRVSVLNPSLVVNPEEGPFLDEVASMPFEAAHTFLAHFVLQSYERYLARKIRLPRDDMSGAYRDCDSNSTVHALNNQARNHCFAPYLSDISEQLLASTSRKQRKGDLDSALFDMQFYMDSYPDLQRAQLNSVELATRHYLEHGREEGRVTFDPYFDLAWYKQQQDIEKGQLGPGQIKDGEAVFLYRHWQQHGRPSARLKIAWVMCVNDHQAEYKRMCLVALQSAKSFACHVDRYVVYDGQDPLFVQLLSQMDPKVTLIRHVFSLKDEIKSDVVCATLLRAYIPVLLNPDKYTYYLYTDVDVVWQRDPMPFLTQLRPSKFMASPEELKAGPNKTAFNPGVMLCNAAYMRQNYGQLCDFLRQNEFKLSALNEFYDLDYSRLDPWCNWRPYWGLQSQAYLIHFQGPKAHHILHEAKYESLLKESFAQWYNPSTKASYVHYSTLYQHYLQELVLDEKQSAVQKANTEVPQPVSMPITAVVFELGGPRNLASVASLLLDQSVRVVAMEPDLARQATQSSTRLRWCDKPAYYKRQRQRDSGVIQACITVKQLVHDYARFERVSLIHADLEGEEEWIFKDLLYFVFHERGCQLNLALTPSRWTSSLTWSEAKAHVEQLFELQEALPDELKDSSIRVVLTKPKPNTSFIKSPLPCFIIGWNQVTYIKQMVEQLERHTTDICIIDNGSTFAPLLDYYAKEFPYTLLRQDKNYGHNVWAEAHIQRIAGMVFAITDPDLQFHPRLPDNMLEILAEISERLHANRTGMSLVIHGDDFRSHISAFDMSIQQWESNFWKSPIGYIPLDNWTRWCEVQKRKYPLAEIVDKTISPAPSHLSQTIQRSEWCWNRPAEASPYMECYFAQIDTTFCVVNRRFQNGAHVRVAGDFLCKHIPWHSGFQDQLVPGEYHAYMTKDNKSSNNFKLLSGDGAWTAWIHIYLLCYNEAALLPATIAHYRRVFRNPDITICDNHSTDQSREIAISLGCRVHVFASGGELDDTINKDLKNSLWKDSKATWIVAADMDEWLCITEAQLREEDSKGVNIILTVGYDMFTEEDYLSGPSSSSAIHSVRSAVRNKYEDKRICFQRSTIEEMNFDLGAHHCDPEPRQGQQVRMSERSYVLKHMAYIGYTHCQNKHRARWDRSIRMRTQGAAHHYRKGEEEFRVLWNDKKSKIEDIGALLLGDSEHVNSNQPCRVVICTIVLQEEHYLDEWIRYHRRVGFDHIYLYDNSQGYVLKHWPDLYHIAGTNPDPSSFLTVIHMPGQGMQADAYAHFLQHYGRASCESASWVAVLDADEFFVPRAPIQTVQEYLKAYANTTDNGDAVGCMSINWLVFGSNGLEFYDPRPVLQRFSKRATHLDQHIKCISYVPHVLKFDHPHFPILLKSDTMQCDVFGKRIHPARPYRIFDPPLDPSQVPACIHHYFTKSRDEFRNKCDRGNADNLPMRSWKEFDEFNVSCNETMDRSAWLLFQARVEFDDIVVCAKLLDD